MNIITRAQALLSSHGLDAYAPGQYVGRCAAPYAVLRLAGTYPAAQGARLRYTLMQVYCYAPLDAAAPQRLDAFARAVKSALRGMANQARPTGREGPDTLEEAYRALSRMLEYQVLLAPEEE